MNDNVLNNQEITTNESQSSNSIKSLDENKKYTLPKNAKKLDPSVLQSLSPIERVEYEKALKRPKKVGYAICNKKYNSFYSINVLDFLPLFIGTFLSFIRFCVGFGDLKKEVVFDKKMLWDFKSAFILGCVYTFFIVPLILLLILFLYPFVIVGGSEVTKGWNYFINQINQGGVSGLGTAIGEYYRFAVKPIFMPPNLVITLILFLVISMLNTKTFLYKFLLRQKRDNLYVAQKQSIKDEIVKLKLSKKK